MKYMLLVPRHKVMRHLMDLSKMLMTTLLRSNDAKIYSGTTPLVGASHNKILPLGILAQVINLCYIGDKRV